MMVEDEVRVFLLPEKEEKIGFRERKKQFFNYRPCNSRALNLCCPHGITAADQVALIHASYGIGELVLAMR